MRREEHNFTWGNLFSHKSTNVVLQADPTAADRGRFAREDLSVYTKYHPTEDFLGIKDLPVAYKHLKAKKKLVSRNMEDAVKNHVYAKDYYNTIYELGMQTLRYITVVSARSGEQAKLKKEGATLLKNLGIFNTLSETQTKDANLVRQIQKIMALEVLDKATELAFKNQAPVNLSENMTPDEKEYWERINDTF